MSEQNTAAPHAEEPYDVVIIGSGVVGCAIARKFTLEGAKTAVVEKGPDILDGASKANSAILHTGFDAPPDSIEHHCILEGYRLYNELHTEMGLPLDRCGAYVIAWDKEQLGKLDSILNTAQKNEVTDTSLIDGEELRHCEPELSSDALAAVKIPGESLIDPWSAPYAYLRQSIQMGADVLCSCEVIDGHFDGEVWQLETSRGSIRTREVVNAAGLYGDRINLSLLGQSKFTITPRKGQFVVYDKAASKLINSILLPVPSDRTKGIVIFRTVFGNLAVGPTAEDQQSRTDASTHEAALRQLHQAGVNMVPALKNMPITATYAGLRPATEFKDYQIDSEPEKHWITVGGIRSTGLSGALGIAQYVYRLYEWQGYKHQPPEKKICSRSPALAENSTRDWQEKDHGEIVCHCELVTKREILKALEGPLGAKSLGGLKRQTRVMMGRCQGFYCMPQIAELTDQHFKDPLFEDKSSG